MRKGRFCLRMGILMAVIIGGYTTLRGDHHSDSTPEKTILKKDVVQMIAKIDFKSMDNRPAGVYAVLGGVKKNTQNVVKDSTDQSNQVILE